MAMAPRFDRGLSVVRILFILYFWYLNFFIHFVALAKNLLLTKFKMGHRLKFVTYIHTHTHRHTDRQTDRQTHRVTTEGTLSGFQDFFLQPIIKDRPNMVICFVLISSSSSYLSVDSLQEHFTDFLFTSIKALAMLKSIWCPIYKDKKMNPL